MNKSESITELSKALNKFQGEVGSIKKDSVNPFFKSKYAGLSAIWDVIRPLLKANGLSVIQGGLAPQEHQDDQGDWWTGILQMETTIIHSSGEWISTVIPMKPKQDDPQGMGSAITYARRYGISAMLGIVADEDDDAEADKKPPKKAEPEKKAESKPTKKKQSYPDALLKELGEAAQELEGDGIRTVKLMVAAKFDAESVRDLSEEQAKILLEDIKSNIKA